MPKNETQLGLFFPKAGSRPPGWIQYKERMVVINLQKRKDNDYAVKILLGHICSWPGSHGSGLEVDNVKKTIVWFNESIRMVDNADDAHEESFNPQDPLLLKREEAELLKDYELATRWFDGKFTPSVVRLIVDALNTTDLDKISHAEEFAHSIQKTQEILHSETVASGVSTENTEGHRIGHTSWWKQLRVR